MPAQIATRRCCSIALIAGLVSLSGVAETIQMSLAHVDAALLRRAVPGDEFRLMEYPEPMPSELAADCRERRRFGVFKRLPEGQRTDRITHLHAYDITVLLCHAGALGVDRYQATLEASQQMIQAMGQSEPSLAQVFKSVPIQIGNRNGTAAPILEIGHGIVVTPIAVIVSRDPALCLIATWDEPLVGETGHTPVAAAVSALAEVLRLADQASGPPP